jgi:hypothetical protein
MGIELPEATVSLSGEEKYVLTLILQSAKRQMEDWRERKKCPPRSTIPHHYQIVCSLLQNVDPELPPKGATP